MNKIPRISPTMLIRPYTKILMDDIPSFILDKARIFGSELMEELEANFLYGAELNSPGKEIKQEIEATLGEIIEVECFLKNKRFHGTIDILGKNYFGEIKTRSNNLIRWSDRVQMLVYAEMLEFKKTPFIIIYNKKENKILIKKIEFNEKDKQLLNSFYRIYKNLWDEKKLWKDNRYNGRN